MHSWAVVAGFGIAYFGGSMASIVYRDAKDQGKGKLVGVLWSLGIALVSCVLFTLVVTLLGSIT